MPNIKAAKKRVKQDAKKNLINTHRKSDVKTAVKKVLDAVIANNLEQAQLLLKEAQAKLARAKGKGVLHAKTASRKISRLARQVATLSK